MAANDPANSDASAPSTSNAQESAPITPVASPRLAAQAAPGSGYAYDNPLVEVLRWFCSHFDRHVPAEGITAGLPLRRGRLTLDLIPRAAERAGLKARVVKKPLSRIHPWSLPVGAVLRDGQACILKSIGETEVGIILPESGEFKAVPRGEFEKNFSGLTILFAPERSFEARAEELVEPKPKSWFWGLVFSQRKIYAEVIMAALLVNIFALASPLFVMNVYDRVVPNQAFETLWTLASGVILIMVFDFIMRSLRGWYIDLAGRRVDVKLSQRLFEHVLGMSLSAKPASSGGFSNQLHEFESVRDFLTSATLATLVDLPFSLLYISMMAVVAGPLALITALAMPLVLLSAVLIEMPMRRAVERAQLASAQRHAIAVESLAGLEAIKLTGSAGQVQRKWEEFTGMAAEAGLRSRKLSSLGINITTLVQQALYVTVIIVGVYQVSEGKLSLGGLIAAGILSSRATAPLAGFANLLTRYHRFRASLRGLNKLIALPQERPEGAKFLRRDRLRGDIRVEQVTFRYTGQPIDTLNELSVTIEAGEKVALVGPVGAGKSTLLKLVAGLYAPNAGLILLDNSDQRQIDPLDMRRNISLVSQEALLFYGSLRENLQLAAPWVEDHQILAMCRALSIDDFARRHPRGYDMQVGERGEGLSGGQRQAVALARTLLANAPILLMDEPTSAMDRRAELRVEAVIREHVKGKTLLLATHKPQLLSLVDRMIVIDQGKVAMDGPRDVVLKNLEGRNRPAPAATVAANNPVDRAAGNSVA